jgi:hypothetical protein
MRGREINGKILLEVNWRNVEKRKRTIGRKKRRLAERRAEQTEGRGKK